MAKRKHGVTYNPKYHPDKVAELLAEGLKLDEAAPLLETTINVLKMWMRRYPEFREAVEVAKPVTTGVHGNQIYNPHYHPNKFIELMSQGLSQTAAAGEFGVSQSTVSKWIGSHPEFKEAVEIAKSKREAWYDEKGRLGMLGKIEGFQFGVWRMHAQKSFGFADKSETEVGISTDSVININFIEREEDPSQS